MKSMLSWKEYKLVIGWISLTSIGFVLGEVFLEPLAFDFVPISLAKVKFDWFGIMIGLASGSVIGLSVGSLQWIILRNYLDHIWLWIVASLLGMASGNFIQHLVWALDRRYLSPQYITDETVKLWALFWLIEKWVTYLIPGLLVGLFQGVLLRKHFSKTWTWVIVNALSLALATAMVKDVLDPMFYPAGTQNFLIPIFEADYFYIPKSEIVIYSLMGILFGSMTGILLVWLFKQNNSMIQKAN